MLTRALKMALWVMYDHLGKLLLVNVLCVLILAVPAGLAYGAARSGDPVVAMAAGMPMLLLLAALLPILSAGTAQMVKELIETRDGSVAAFFTGVRRWWWRAMRLGLFYAGVMVCLGVSVWFYAGRVGASFPVLGYALSALALWCALFMGLGGLLAMPALVQKGEGVLATVKLSALLVLDNPLFCMGLALWCGLLAALSVVPLMLVFMSLAPQVVLVSSAYEMLSRKYAAIEAAGRAAWKKRPADEVFGDAEDDYLNRGFRDFIFPWKS